MSPQKQLYKKWEAGLCRFWKEKLFLSIINPILKMYSSEGVKNFNEGLSTVV